MRINEGWSKSFQTGAAICTAVVLAPSSGRCRTRMFSESACQDSRRWDDVGRYYTCVFGVMYVTRGDFYDGSEKGTASVH